MVASEQKTRRASRRREEALRTLGDRLRRVVGAQIASGATPSPVLLALGGDGRVRVWPVPPDFPQARFHERRATTGLLRSLIARVDSVAYGLVLTVPPPPSGQDPALRAWVRALGPEACPVIVQVSDGLARRASAAFARTGAGGDPAVEWREVTPLEGSLARLDEPLALRRQTAPTSGVA
jgi:hypothetical protein